MDDFSLLKHLKDWSWLIGMISTGLFGWAMLYLRDKFITKEEHTKQLAALSGLLAEVKKEHGEVGNRVLKLETLTENLPDREDFQNMALRMAGVEKAVAVTTETVGGVEKIVAKIDRTLDLLLATQLKAEAKVA